nr:hypothetical protein [Desulfurococcales archaeon]
KTGLAAAMIAVGAAVAVAYPYGLFYAPRSLQWLLVRATLAAAALLVGAFISATGIAVLALGRAGRGEAEDTGEG